MTEDKKVLDIYTQRFESLKEKRNKIEKIWDKLIDYLIPEHKIDSNLENQRSLGDLIFDGQPQTALQLLVDGFTGQTIAPSMRWFKLKFPDYKEYSGLNRIGIASKWLYEVEEEIYYNLQKSNFYDAMHEFIHDGASFGTAVIYTDYDIYSKKLVFSVRNPYEVYIDENRFGKVDTVFRKFVLSAREIVEKFEDVDEKYLKEAEKSPDTKYTILHAVTPVQDWNEKISQIKKFGKKWASVYIDIDNNEVLSIDGYKYNPYSVWRWRKLSGELYGFSPSITALIDIIKLNSISKDLLKASHQSVNPPLNVPEELKGKVKIKAGGINYYKDVNRQIFPINTGVNYPVGVDRENRIREIIREHFKVDFFLMLANAQRQMTATEIMERQSEKAIVLGATVGRLNTEAISKILQRVYYLLSENGDLPEMPMTLKTLKQIDLQIDFLSPLAMAQKKMLLTGGIMETMGSIAQIMQINPDVVDIINFDEVVLNLVRGNNFPENALRSIEEIAQIRKAKAIQKQQLMQMQQQQAQADMVNKLRKEIEPNSALELIAKQQGGGLGG